MIDTISIIEKAVLYKDRNAHEAPLCDMIIILAKAVDELQKMPPQKIKIEHRHSKPLDCWNGDM
jgi:hypothetical protein